MSVLRVGILGPGNIVARVLKDFELVEGAVITAVASRSLERAKKVAAQTNALHAFGSYEELAACPDVDLVYIATPHNFHMEQAILCMKAGKHVLCEKPMAINAAQTQLMIDCAKENNVFLMEGMWTRFFPANLKLVELIKDGIIGDVQLVDVKFAFRAGWDPEGRLLNPELAGGSLLDVGVYTSFYATMVLGYDYIKVMGTLHVGETGVDEYASYIVAYDGGKVAMLTSGVRLATPHTAFIYGTEGSIIVPDFWHATRFTVNKAGCGPEEYTFGPENEGFRHEFDHVCECINKGLKESPIVPLAESIAVTKIQEQLRLAHNMKYPFE